eukprot:6205617-Pleurochrysis_carterae.AAC.5
MHGLDGGKPCRKSQAVSCTDLVVVDRHISIEIVSGGAGQDTEREPQAPLQGTAHEGGVHGANEADKWGQHARKPQQ